MASIGDQIVVAMVAALNAASPKLATCYRMRVDAFNAAQLPAFVLYSVREQVHRKSRDTVLRTRTVRLEVMVAGAPPVDELIDPLYVSAIKTLFADPGFGNLDLAFEETAAIWEEAPGYPEVAMAAFDFDVTYATQLADPTVKSVAG